MLGVQPPYYQFNHSKNIISNGHINIGGPWIDCRATPEKECIKWAVNAINQIKANKNIISWTCESLFPRNNYIGTKLEERRI